MIEGGHRLLSILVWMPFRRTLASIAFWMGRHVFVHIPAKGTEFVKEVFSGEGLGVIMKLLPIYAFVAVFWSLYDQTGSSWIGQAVNMDRNFMGVEWLESQVGAINPLLILTFIPLFSGWERPFKFPGLYALVERVVPLNPLRKVGFTVVVDDLGAGEGALMLLAEAAPAYIKAHGSIVRGVVDSPHKIRILEMLGRFATGTRAQLIAEGVEREEEAAALRGLGVPFLQGYLFGRPSSPDELLGPSSAAPEPLRA